MKTARKISYDSRSYDLAEHFLQDTKDATEAMKKSLARDIQQAVEDWFSGNE